MFKKIEFLFWILVALFIMVPILNTVIQNWVSANGTLAQEFNATDPNSRYATERKYVVSLGTDDAEVFYSGHAWTILLALGSDYAGYGQVAFAELNGAGMRFQSIYVPTGIPIAKAHIVFTSEGNSAANIVKSTITGEKVLDASTFSTLANFQSRRGIQAGGATNNNITTANVTWDSIPAWVINTEYESPDIAPVIQEIIGQNGWVNGNDIVLFWDDYAGRSTAGIGTNRAGYSYDGSPSNAPQLHITYLPDNIALTPLETAVTQFYVPAFVIFFAVIILYVLSKGGNSGGGGGAYN